MKKIVLVLVLASIIACKNKKEQSEESNNVQKVETNEEAKIDYISFGMQNDDVPKGLEKGSKAPEAVLMIDGKEVALSDMYKDQTVVLFFYRGFWCPYCNKHLAKFSERAKELEDKGVKLIAITPETQVGIEKIKAKTGANFIIVSDKNGSIQRAFDVDYKVTDGYAAKVSEMLKVSIAENNGSSEAELPVPATYIINNEGTIVYSHFNPDYKNRASIDDILANLPE